MSQANTVERTGVSGWSAAGAADVGDPSKGRVDLRRVLVGLRHLEASPEPGSGVTELAAVCVPALCDECLIQIAEHGRRPYRIRRAWPDMTGTPPSLTDEAFIAVTQGRGTPLEWGRTGGAVVETTERDVLARFTNPPGDGPDYHGVLVCRWTEGMPPTRAMPGWSGCSPNMSSRLSTANAPPVRSTPATWPRTSRPL